MSCSTSMFGVLNYVSVCRHIYNGRINGVISLVWDLIDRKFIKCCIAVPNFRKFA